MTAVAERADDAPGQNGGRAGLLLLLTPVIWGTTFPAAKVALRDLSPWTFMAWSRALGLAAILLLVVWRRPPASAWRAGLLPAGGVLGGLLFLGYGLQTVGLSQTSATNAGFITVLYVVLAPAGAALLDRRVPGPGTVAWVGCSLAGLALLSLRGGSFRPGDLLVLAGALAFACHIVAVDRFVDRFDPVALTVAQLAAATLLGVLAAVPSGPQAGAAAADALILLLTGALGSGVAYAVQVVAQQSVSPARTSVLLAGEALVSAVTAAIWLGERLTARQWLGAVLVLAAMVGSELHAHRLRVRAVAGAPRHGA